MEVAARAVRTLASCAGAIYRLIKWFKEYGPLVAEVLGQISAFIDVMAHPGKILGPRREFSPYLTLPYLIYLPTYPTYTRTLHCPSHLISTLMPGMATVYFFFSFFPPLSLACFFPSWLCSYLFPLPSRWGRPSSPRPGHSHQPSHLILVEWQKHVPIASAAGVSGIWIQHFSHN